ncbi:MAG TPA: ABC transporter permease [Candidatus Cybelea sp.]|nr:ABC transporter permease [Candidatus Cybelea sp.]
MTVETTKRLPLRPAPQRSFFHVYRIQVSITALLLLLYVVFIIGDPKTYLSFNIYRSFMISIPFFGLMAMAATFIVTLGEIDLSFPSAAGMSGWVFASSYIYSGSFLLALVLCLATGALIGLINGLLVTKIGIPSIVATIGTMFLWGGLVNVVTEGHGIPMTQLLDDPLHALFVGQLFDRIPAQFIWFVAGSILMGVLYKRHRFGSHILFIGDNAESARMMGIHVDRVKILCFVIMGVSAALSVVFILNQLTFFWATTGSGYLLTTLAAVFIGGTSVFGGKGTMIGSFVGVLIIASLEPGIIAIGLTGFYTQFIYGLLITISVAVYALMLRRRD